MTIPQANEVRLQREVQQFLQDRVGWFTLAPSTQETEIGFIYAVMAETNQPGGSRQAAGASVRVNWWQYWFSKSSEHVLNMVSDHCSVREFPSPTWLAKTKSSSQE